MSRTYLTDDDADYHDWQQLIDRWTGIQPILFVAFILFAIVAGSLMSWHNRQLTEEIDILTNQVQTGSDENARLRETSLPTSTR